MPQNGEGITMYYFQHPKHTGGEQQFIGNNEFEAHEALTQEYGIELDDIVFLLMNGFVWQAPLVEPHPYSIADWFAQRYA